MNHLDFVDKQVQVLAAKLLGCDDIVENFLIVGVEVLRGDGELVHDGFPQLGQHFFPNGGTVSGYQTHDWALETDRIDNFNFLKF